MQYAISWTRTLKDFPKSFIEAKKVFVNSSIEYFFLQSHLLSQKRFAKSAEKIWEARRQPEGKTFLFQIFLWNAVICFPQINLCDAPIFEIFHLIAVCHFGCSRCKDLGAAFHFHPWLKPNPFFGLTPHLLLLKTHYFLTTHIHIRHISKLIRNTKISKSRLQLLSKQWLG